MIPIDRESIFHLLLSAKPCRRSAGSKRKNPGHHSSSEIFNEMLEERKNADLPASKGHFAPFDGIACRIFSGETVFDTPGRWPYSVRLSLMR